MDEDEVLAALPAIHRAAYEGDLAEVKRLLAEDGRRLHARLEEETQLDDWLFCESTPIMLAALGGQKAVVAWLLEQGADAEEQDNHNCECSAVHYACMSGCPATLALLLGVVAPAKVLREGDEPPLILAVRSGSLASVELLLSRHGALVDVNAQTTMDQDRTPLHYAAWEEGPGMVRLLLEKGADPTIADENGERPIDYARREKQRSEESIRLLEAAAAEPHRARALFRARGIIDTAAAVPKAFENARAKGRTLVEQHRAALGAAPGHLKGRVAWATEMPRVEVGGSEDKDEELVACVKYALGLEGGSGVVVIKGQEPSVGMLPEVLMELLDMLVPKWDPARKGEPLGAFDKQVEPGQGH